MFVSALNSFWFISNIKNVGMNTLYILSCGGLNANCVSFFDVNTTFNYGENRIMCLLVCLVNFVHLIIEIFVLGYFASCLFLFFKDYLYVLVW